MPQSSAPLVGVNLSDVDWRDSFGDEAGVLGDLDGTAYKLTLPTNSDDVTIGSATQRSMARVAGFIHRIPAGETESLTIPAASGSARTDIIALRYDPAFTGAPGPVRLARIAGTSVERPTYDAAAPGIEDLPLWQITRQPGQALSQAVVKPLFPRLAPSLGVPADAPLPLSSPLDTVAKRSSEVFRRELGAGGVPVWVNQSPAVPTPVNLALASGFQDWGFGYRSLCYWRDGATVHVVGAVRLLSNMSPATTRVIATLPTGFRPTGTVQSSGMTTYARTEVLNNGQLRFNNDTFGVTIVAGTLVAVNMIVPLG